MEFPEILLNFMCHSRNIQFQPHSKNALSRLFNKLSSIINSLYCINYKHLLFTYTS